MDYLHTKMKYLFCGSIVLFMPLGVYSSGIPSFSLADVVVLGSFLLLLLYSLYLKRLCAITKLLPFILYILLSLIINIGNGVSIFRTLRFVFYLLYVSIFITNFYDYKLIKTILVWFSIFATAFIVLQYIIFKIFNYYIPGYLPFIQLASDDLLSYSEGIYNTASTAKRMRSVFTEPAHYGAYVSLGLLVTLREYEANNNSKYLKFSIILTIGLLICSATTAYVMIVLLWGLLLVRETSFVMQKKYFNLLVLIAILIPFVVQTNSVQLVIERLKDGGTQSGRFNGYKAVTLILDDLSNWIFGVGMIDMDIYLASWPRLLSYFGFLGIMIYLFPLLSCGTYSLLNRTIVIYMIILGMGTAMLVSGNSMLPLTLLLGESTKNLADNS